MAIQTQQVPTIKASQIEAMLKEGKDRKVIAEELGIPQSVLKRIMNSCPQLKGRKPVRHMVEFINDLACETASPANTESAITEDAIVAGASVESPSVPFDPNQD